MTNQLAVFLATAIVLALAGDLIWLDGQASLILARKFFEMLEWVAFWR